MSGSKASLGESSDSSDNHSNPLDNTNNYNSPNHVTSQEEITVLEKVKIVIDEKPAHSHPNKVLSKSSKFNDKSNRKLLSNKQLTTSLPNPKSSRKHVRRTVTVVAPLAVAGTSQWEHASSPRTSIYLFFIFCHLLTLWYEYSRVLELENSPNELLSENELLNKLSELDSHSPSETLTPTETQTQTETQTETETESEYLSASEYQTMSECSVCESNEGGYSDEERMRISEFPQENKSESKQVEEKISLSFKLNIPSSDTNEFVANDSPSPHVLSNQLNSVSEKNNVSQPTQQCETTSLGSPTTTPREETTPCVSNPNKSIFPVNDENQDHVPISGSRDRAESAGSKKRVRGLTSSDGELFSKNKISKNGGPDGGSNVPRTGSSPTLSRYFFNI